MISFSSNNNNQKKKTNKQKMILLEDSDGTKDTKLLSIRNMVLLTSTENCKSLLVLTTDLKSTCTVGQNVMNSTRRGGWRGKASRVKSKHICTLVSHLRAISCSTPIDKGEGSRFNFPASL